MKADHSDTVCRIAFSMLRGVTVTQAEELLRRFGSERQFFELTSSQLSAITARRIRIFEDAYRAELLERAEKEAQFVDNHDVKLLYFIDEDYPKRLLDCPDAPVMIYGMGNCDLNVTPVISIVGTRHATPYGLNFTRRLVEELSARLVNPPLIVSGLAHGIDIAAHNVAIAAKVPTAAVVAHGLNTIYPAAHRNIAADIARRSGILLTEYPSDTVVHRGNFLARNRIIAGLADCTIVVESALKGGALVTARTAQSYSRDVFALPGRTSDEYSRGCNRLIARNMAALLEDADSLIEAMGWPCRSVEGEQQSLPMELGPDEQEIIDYLKGKGEAQLNTMSVELNRPISKLMGALVDLEFKELILTYPGGFYRLA